MALAAAAQINTRQGVSGPVAPPPPLPQQHQQQQRPQHMSGPPPPPGPQGIRPQGIRPQIPNQQQFLYQQGVLPPQGQQIRGPAPRAVGPGNIRFPIDPYQQQLQQQQQQQFINPPQQRQAPNPNYNQSNNNELYDQSDNDGDDFGRRTQDEQSRSAQKILDAFERYYVNHGKTASVPMKVKYIPEEMNSNSKHFNSFQQRNTNNNNRHRSSSRRSSSSSPSSESNSIYSNSPVSSRRSFYDNHQSNTVEFFPRSSLFILSSSRLSVHSFD